MDSTLKRIGALTSATDDDVRCAALLILTHLGVTDERIVQMVGATIDGKNSVVRDLAVGYFERLRPTDGLRFLLPLLDSSDDALRQRVTKILAAYGGSAVTATKKLIKDGPKRRLTAIVELCAAVHSAAAFDLLFDLMSHEDFDTHRAACEAVIAILPSLDKKARADVWQRAEKLLKAAKGHRSATIGAAKLLGALAETRARTLLLPLLDKECAHSIRTHALGALTHCLRGETLTPKEIDILVPLLSEDDESGILRPTISLLAEQRLDRSLLPQLNKLAETGHPLVRRFAVQKLGTFDSGSVVKTLIGYLTDDSYARRDQAANSLKHLAAARTALMKEFLACDDERKAWTLADILLVHDRDWKESALQSLRKRLEVTLEASDDRLYTAYFHFLSTLDANDVAQHAKQRAQMLGKKKDFSACLKWLTLLKDTPAFDDATRLALAVADLKARKHAVIGGVRRNDPALEQLRALAQSTFPLVDELSKDRSLEAEELFYVAFNFAEGNEDDRSVAAELLELVVEKYGRTKVGKAAKNKLKLLGPR